MEVRLSKHLTVYRLVSEHKDGATRYYVGSTNDIENRFEKHKETLRYKDVVHLYYEVLGQFSDTLESLKYESEMIDKELGGKLANGNREHFDGRCLNRTTVASAPIGRNKQICYSKAKGYFIKGSK